MISNTSKATSAEAFNANSTVAVPFVGFGNTLPTVTNSLDKFVVDNKSGLKFKRTIGVLVVKNQSLTASSYKKEVCGAETPEVPTIKSFGVTPPYEPTHTK